MFFLRNFMNNDLAAAERVGVKITGVDRLLFAVALAHITVKMGSYRLASKIPGLADAAGLSTSPIAGT